MTVWKRYIVMILENEAQKNQELFNASLAGTPVKISNMTIKLFLLAGYWLDNFDREGKG